jgi:hypothetical protein
MRKCWTRASRSCRIGVVLLVVSTAVPATAAGPPRAASAAVDCSIAAADRALTREGHPTEPGATHAAGEVACGAFVGPGMQGMAATIANGTCWPNVGWVVFGSSGGAWQRVPGGDTLRVFSIKAVGSTLRETVPIYRSADSPCFPTGGRKVRTWRWDGTRLKPGPFKRVGHRAPRTSATFYSPSRNIACEMRDVPGGGGSEVYCQSRTHPHSTVIASGKGFVIDRKGVRRVRG